MPFEVALAIGMVVGPQLPGEDRAHDLQQRAEARRLVAEALDQLDVSLVRRRAEAHDGGTDQRALDGGLAAVLHQDLAGHQPGHHAPLVLDDDVRMTAGELQPRLVGLDRVGSDQDRVLGERGGELRDHLAEVRVDHRAVCRQLGRQLVERLASHGVQPQAGDVVVQQAEVGVQEDEAAEVLPDAPRRLGVEEAHLWTQHVDPGIAGDVDRHAAGSGETLERGGVVGSPGQQRRDLPHGDLRHAPRVVPGIGRPNETLFVEGDDLVAQLAQDGEHPVAERAHALGQIDAARHGIRREVDVGARAQDHREAALGRDAAEQELGIELPDLVLYRDDQSGCLIGHGLEPLRFEFHQGESIPVRFDPGLLGCVRETQDDLCPA